jgi:dTDP-4-dehydrorhamnose reductase
MRRIFLTGSTSYLGTKFIELYGSRFEILGIARSDSKTPVDLLDFEAVKATYANFSPDIIIHVAADIGRDSTTSKDIIKTNLAATENLVDLALTDNVPFIFTSTEAVYGGKEEGGEYTETDPYKPRSPYGASKVESEKILIASGLPYLITRGHRHVGISKSFSNPKQFPDSLKALVAKQQIHLDSHRFFKPVLINHICDVFIHYLENDIDKQLILNVGVDKATTYYSLVQDVAAKLDLNTSLIKSDGEEAGWPQNSILSLNRLVESGYPVVSYEQLLDVIKTDFLS